MAASWIHVIFVLSARFGCGRFLAGTGGTSGPTVLEAITTTVACDPNLVGLKPLFDTMPNGLILDARVRLDLPPFAVNAWTPVIFLRHILTLSAASFFCRTN